MNISKLYHALKFSNKLLAQNTFEKRHSCFEKFFSFRHFQIVFDQRSVFFMFDRNGTAKNNIVAHAIYPFCSFLIIR